MAYAEELKSTRKEETNGIGKERTVETLGMRLLEMAICPGAGKEKRTEGRGKSLEVECVGEVFLHSKVDPMQDTGYSRRELAIEVELKREKRLRESH